jgi:hypothetical protein
MIIDVSQARIDRLIIHRIVSQSSDQKNKFSEEEVALNGEMRELLARFFFASLKSQDLSVFTQGALEEPESVCAQARALFDGDKSFIEASCEIGEILHDASKHPQVKDGDLYVARIDSCYWNGQEVQALGIFKSEVKETFINLVEDETGFHVERSEGFSINRMDKGCLILDAERDKGFVLSVFDNTSKGSRRANYWMDEFLCATVRKDSRYYTEHTVKNVKDFLTKELPKKKESFKETQMEAMDKTVDYFREKEKFDRKEYAETVFADEDTRREFSDFLSCKNDGLDDWDHFPIAEEAVKKTSRFMKKVIKLDKDYSIYVHGNGNFMQKGFDPEYGLKFYKIFYTEEK